MVEYFIHIHTYIYIFIYQLLYKLRYSIVQICSAFLQKPITKICYIPLLGKLFFFFLTHCLYVIWKWFMLDRKSKYQLKNNVSAFTIYHGNFVYFFISNISKTTFISIINLKNTSTYHILYILFQFLLAISQNSMFLFIIKIQKIQKKLEIRYYN